MGKVIIDFDAYKSFEDNFKKSKSNLISIIKKISDLNTSYETKINAYLQDNSAVYNNMVKSESNSLINSVEDIATNVINKISNISNKYQSIEKDSYNEVVMLAKTLFDINNTSDSNISKNTVINKEQEEKASLFNNKAVKNFLNNFDYQKFHMTKEELEEELWYIYCQRGKKEVNYIMNALLNNEPDNYDEYEFNTKELLHDQSYYNFSSNVNEYETNSENITINNYTFEFVQVLDKDITNIERLAYNFCKANVINTLKTLPDTFLAKGVSGSSNAIVLTSSREVFNRSSTDWAGFYKTDNSIFPSHNTIVIDAHGSLYANTYYTQDVVIHEMSHKFDDMLYEGFFKNTSLGGYYYTKNDRTWKDLYSKYNKTVSSINSGGYEDFPDEQEFFSDAMVAYYKSGDHLKKLCPEVYDYITNLLGADYGNCYTNKIGS